jgi:hypothetical protein
MPGSTEGQLLPQQTASYRRTRWRRAIRDTKQVIKEDIRLEVIIAVATAMVGAALRYYTGEPSELNTLLFSLLFGLAALGVVVVVYFLFYFFTAPSHMDEEKQKRIAELESQLERQLNLDVNIPFVFPITTDNFPTLQHLGKGGVVMLLRDLRLTNRSKTHKVSLSLTLRVRLDDALVLGNDIESPVYLVVQSYEEFHKGLSPGQFLFNPININPESTVHGDMCFSIFPVVLNAHGENKSVNYHSCLLDIVDHVSGEGLTKNIDQRFLESPTAQLVK